MRARAVLVVATCVAVGVAAFAIVYAAGGPAALHARFGLAATGAVVVAQAALGFWPVPASEALAAANGALHGFWAGTALAWSGWMLTALAQYEVARRVALDLDVDAGMRRLPAWVRRFPVDHPAFLILARIVPGPGPQLVNCAAGALRVPLRRHLWCAAVGILPGAMLVSAAGAGLAAL